MLGLIVAMFAASCDTELDDSSIKFTPRLVVNSFVNSDDFFLCTSITDHTNDRYNLP